MTRASTSRVVVEDEASNIDNFVMDANLVVLGT
jgi:hypothetical protein